MLGSNNSLSVSIISLIINSIFLSTVDKDASLATDVQTEDSNEANIPNARYFAQRRRALVCELAVTLNRKMLIFTSCSKDYYTEDTQYGYFCLSVENSSWNMLVKCWIH